MKRCYTFFTLLYLLFGWVLHAQSQDSLVVAKDSVTQHEVKDVIITAYFNKPLQTVTASVAVIDTLQLVHHANNLLLGAINTVPGVRMEERSPGSYRLSIRGSVLRSPFGVRNVKLYLAGICLTDGSGNSYLNIIDPSTVSSIEILKGPDASIYGANTGGVVLVEPLMRTNDSLTVSGIVQAGSYGYVQARLLYQQKFKKYTIQASQSYMRSDGYRENTAMQQLSTQVHQKWQYIPKAKFKLYLMYTNLRYRTPGGLTEQQFNENPRQARPATNTLPGAIEQQAGIYNSTVLGGLIHEIDIRPNLRHFVSVTVSHTNFKNPFVTNYEVRSEQNVNARTYVEWSQSPTDNVQWNWINGLEAQQNFSAIDNYDNDKGERAALQQAYKFKAGNYFAFSGFGLTLLRRINIEGAFSLNYSGYWYKSVAPVDGGSYKTNFFKPQLMPRLGVSVRLAPQAIWRASVSRGFSPPTLAEVYPSANDVSLNLQPESGWCYETGFRLRDKRDIINVDIAGYYYALANTIVVRSDTAGNTYFINAGGTRQWGLESSVVLWVIKPNTNRHAVGLRIGSSYTFAHYRFYNYINGDEDYSGNQLTGVPPHTLVSNIFLQMPLGFYVFAEHNYTHRLPVNDANTAYVRQYNLLQFKVGWDYYIKHVKLSVFAGMQNALNGKYSLGNDLNALGGRYYNAAPPRNYYGGIAIGYSK